MSGLSVIQILLPLFFDCYKQLKFNIIDNRDIYICSYDSKKNESEIRTINARLHLGQTQELGDLKNKVKEMKDEILDLIIGKPSI